MTQVGTSFHQPWGLAGHVSRPDFESESIVSPVKPQTTTLTMGVDPMPNKVYKITFPLGANVNVVHTFDPGAVLSAAAFATALAVSLNANGATEHLFSSAANAATVVQTYHDSSLAFVLPASDAPEITAAITQQVGGVPALFGTLYAYDAIVSGKGAATRTPRRAYPARPLRAGDTKAEVRGIVAREYNSTTLDPFHDNTTPGQYPPGQVGFAVKRGHCHARIDPASGPLSPGGAVYVVLAAGVYSNVGYVAAAADGANTLLVSDGDDPLVRITQEETATTLGGVQVRVVEVKVNRTS